MPDVVRRQVAPPSPTFVDDTSSEIEDFSDIAAQNTAFLEEEGLLQEEVAGDGHLDQTGAIVTTATPPPPAGWKEISSLACWTVSSSKPGCSVAALRAPTTSLFWQSDGPQPHHLNIHFFKMVSIVGMRVYLDFELDESYTPTLIRFAAGTGYHDLQEFSAMRFEQPRGWIDVDWEGVGDVEGIHDGEFDEPAVAPPVLRCMLVQVRVCENHQNGKDTHLRGLQLFAKDAVGAQAADQFAAKNLGAGELRAPVQAYPSAEFWDLEWMEPPVLR